MTWLELLREYDATWRNRAIPLKQRIRRCEELHRRAVEKAEREPPIIPPNGGIASPQKGTEE